MAKAAKGDKSAPKKKTATKKKAAPKKKSTNVDHGGIQAWERGEAMDCARDESND